MDDSDIKSVVLDDGAILFDARYFPVLFVTWFDTISAAGVEIYRDWVTRMANRAREESTRMFLIEDICDSVRPSPETRRVLARTLKQLAERHGNQYLGGAMILPNAFMRAAFMIVKTLVRMLDYKPVKNVEAALERAFAKLDEAGIARPEGLDAKTHPRAERPTKTA